jgi:methyl-accepting chemotaxis protein
MVLGTQYRLNVHAKKHSTWCLRRKPVFRNLTLAKKLFFGFSAILLLLMVIAVISFKAINDSSKGFTDYRNLARNTIQSGKLQAYMLHVRMSVQNYMLSSGDQKLEEYNKHWSQMQTLLAEGRKLISDPERLALLEETNGLVNDYGKNFKKVIALQGQRDSVVSERLNILGADAEEKLTTFIRLSREDFDAESAYYASQALRSLLLSRLHVVKFLDDNSQKSIDHFNETIALLHDSFKTIRKMVGSVQRLTLLEEIEKTAGQYEAAFSRLAEIIGQQNEIFNGKMQVLGPQIAAKVEQINSLIMGEQEALGPRLQSANDMAVRGVVIIGIVAVILGLFLALMLIRGVLKQLGADPGVIAGIARSIAQGDLRISFEGNKREMVGVYSDMREMVHQIGNVVGEVQSASDNVASGSQELSAAS